MRVELKFGTDYLPPRQVLTGFLMLARQGRVDLDLSVAKTMPDDHPERSLVRATVDGTPVMYDVADDYYFGRDTTERHLEEVDHYFKRSYDPITHDEWRGAEKIKPLGFNYHVEITHPAFMKLNAADPKQAVRRLGRRLTRQEPRPLVEEYEVPPRLSVSPTALFYARVWDPRGESPGEQLSPETASAREDLNEMRADCVVLLREAFGERFSGGLEPTPYALSHRRYSQLIKDRRETSKRAYLARMHRTDICVGSLGLGDANGWKIGEYVAASRAIVNEKMRYLVPGEFAAPRNCLEFATAAGCVEQVGVLMSDPEAVFAMQQANAAYYAKFLRPDQLIWRSLEQVGAS